MSDDTKLSANDNRARPAPHVFVEFRPAMRTLIEDALESLLLLLDEIDGDADFEEEPGEEEGGDMEPSLGSMSAIDQSNWGGRVSLTIDGEAGDDNGLGDIGGLIEQSLTGPSLGHVE